MGGEDDDERMGGTALSDGRRSSEVCACVVRECPESDMAPLIPGCAEKRCMPGNAVCDRRERCRLGSARGPPGTLGELAEGSVTGGRDADGGLFVRTFGPGELIGLEICGRSRFTLVFRPSDAKKPGLCGATSDRKLVGGVFVRGEARSGMGDLPGELAKELASDW